MRIRDSKGLRYIAALVENPGVELPAADLVAAEAAGAGPDASRAARGDPQLETAVGLGDAGAVLDATAKEAYRRRIEELREELEEAESWGDPERVAAARQEMEFVANELRAAVGLGGRDRKAASASERARVNATRAIKSAVKKIADHDAELARQVDLSIRTGTFCSYEPAPGFEIVLADAAASAGGQPEPVVAPAPRQVETELLERRAELDRLLDLLSDALAGRGRLAWVEGPAGIGKTELLRTVSRSAGQATLLQARGGELERAFPFGLVHQLLDREATLGPAAERERLFAGAAAIARRLFDPGEPDARIMSPSEQEAALFHGLYWFVANLAARRPVVMLVDDAHWADPPSLRFLAFLARRLDELSVLLVVAARSSDEDSDRHLMDQVASAPTAQAIEPAPLSRDAVAALVAETLGPAPAPGFVDACVTATGGNPFYLRTLLHELSSSDVAPTSEAADRARTLGPRALGRAILGRVSRVGDDATRLAHAVAVLGDPAEARHAARLAELDPDRLTELAGALERSSILVSDVRGLRFEHPVVRSAVYFALTTADRAALHARAAALLDEEGVAPERVAVHLLHAEACRDPEVVATLQRAAERAAARGGAEAAITYLRRALAEGAPGPHAELVARLGRLELELGRFAEALPTLSDGLESETDPGRRAQMARWLALGLAGSGRPREGIAVVTRTIEGLPESERESALRLEATLGTIALLFSEEAEVLGRLERYGDLPGETPGERRVLANLAYHRTLAGDISAEEACSYADRAVGDGALLREPEVEWASYVQACWVLLTADRYDAADPALARGLEQARRRGSPLGYCATSAYRALSAYRRGDLEASEAEARLTIEAGRAHGLLGAVPPALAFLVWTLIERGELEAADRELEEGGYAGQIPDGSIFHPLSYARAYLRHAQQRYDAAVSDAWEAGARDRRTGRRFGATPWRSIAALAMAARGDRDDALELAEQDLVAARRWGAPRPIAVALRTLGLIHDGHDRLVLLGEAADVLERAPTRLEYARVLVDLGAGLIDCGREEEGTERLDAGFELALRAGASALAERAWTQLVAIGARPRSDSLPSSGPLTAVEKRLADMAAQGLSDDDIAQRLFVMRKTVESIVGGACAKVAAGSRAELRGALAGAH